MDYSKYFENDNRNVVIVINFNCYRSMTEINGEFVSVNTSASKKNYKLVDIRDAEIGNNHFKCILIYEKDFTKENDERTFEFVSKAIDAKFKATMDYLKKKEKNDLITNTKGSY